MCSPARRASWSECRVPSHQVRGSSCAACSGLHSPPPAGRAIGDDQDAQTRYMICACRMLEDTPARLRQRLPEAEGCRRGGHRCDGRWVSKRLSIFCLLSERDAPSDNRQPSTEICSCLGPVNDPFVMGAWGESAGADGKVGSYLHAQLPPWTAASCCLVIALATQPPEPPTPQQS